MFKRLFRDAWEEGLLLLAVLKIPVSNSQRTCSSAKGLLAVSGFPTDQRNGDKEFVIRRAATNRVLNVLRHWVSKHSQVGGGGPGGGSAPRGPFFPTGVNWAACCVA